MTGGVPPIAGHRLAAAMLDPAAAHQPAIGFCSMAVGAHVTCDCVERLGHCAWADHRATMAQHYRARMQSARRAKVGAVIIALVLVGLVWAAS